VVVDLGWANAVDGVFAGAGGNDAQPAASSSAGRIRKRRQPVCAASRPLAEYQTHSSAPAKQQPPTVPGGGIFICNLESWTFSVTSP